MLKHQYTLYAYLVINTIKEYVDLNNRDSVKIEK